MVELSSVADAECRAVLSALRSAGSPPLPDRRCGRVHTCAWQAIGQRRSRVDAGDRAAAPERQLRRPRELRCDRLAPPDTVAGVFDGVRIGAGVCCRFHIGDRRRSMATANEVSASPLPEWPAGRGFEPGECDHVDPQRAVEDAVDGGAAEPGGSGELAVRRVGVGEVGAEASGELGHLLGAVGRAGLHGSVGEVVDVVGGGPVGPGSSWHSPGLPRALTEPGDDWIERAFWSHAVRDDVQQGGDVWSVEEQTRTGQRVHRLIGAALAAEAAGESFDVVAATRASFRSDPIGGGAVPALRVRCSSLVSSYLLCCRPPGWELAGVEVPLGVAVADLVWRRGDSVIVDEVKSGAPPLAEVASQLRRLADGAAVHWPGFVGVRFVPLGDRRRVSMWALDGGRLVEVPMVEGMWPR